MTMPDENPSSLPSSVVAPKSDSVSVSFSENIFTRVKQAIEHGDFIGARNLLNAIEREMPPSYPQRGFLLAMVRSKRELVGVYEIAAQRRYDRDLLNMARYCYRAARESRVGAGTTERQRLRLARARAGYLSTAAKYRAADSLTRFTSSIDEALIRLAKVGRLFNRAAMYANDAAADGSRGSEIHALHMRYSACIASERLAILRLAITGDELHLNQALDAWRGALECAQSLKSAAENTIFPGLYYSHADLSLEDKFIRAVAAFQKHNWPECIDALSRWLGEFPAYYRWTWRYSNVLLRKMGTEVIQAISSNSLSTAKGTLDSLEKLAATEPVGRVGRFFAADVRSLAGKWPYQPLRDATLANLASLFPLDSSVEFHDSVEAMDPFMSLPTWIYAGLTLPQPQSRLEVERGKLRISSVVEALLGFLCDYDFQWQKPPRELASSTRDELLAECEGLRWARKSHPSAALSGLRRALVGLDNASDPESFFSACGSVKGFVRRLTPYFPVQVSIDTKTGELGETTLSVPDWSIERPERDVILLSVEAYEDLPLEPGRYYLPPPWRKGDRRSYTVNTADNRPLFPVRFKPRRKYWDDLVSRLSIPSMTGVPRYLLERAIELAAQCSGEDERVHPKVGAIILLGEQVIAEGYRNEDGLGSHAEEIAFRKTGKRDLKGATVITTLEPCTTGRSNSRVPCAELVLRNGVSRVIIGALDPDPSIRGTSEFLFGAAGVAVEHFPDDLRRCILDLDRDHIELHLKNSLRQILSWAK